MEALDIKEIKRMRLSVGMTQAELARLAGVSQSLIARIEAGNVDPRVSTLNKILKVLREAKAPKIVAKDIMASPVIYVTPNDTVEKAARLMEENDISQLPVIENDVPVGSISESCVVREMANLGDSSFPKKNVREIMEEQFPIVGASTSIDTLLNLTRKYPAVLISEKGKISGIVTKMDIVRLIR
ncbi:MAG: CBS domain-containing protein [Candidatus Hydrothermarchaeota archaeon]